MDTLITSKEELIIYLAHKYSVKYLFFWGHKKPQDGSVEKTCMSQWYEADFDIDGIDYPTAEHYMMSEKARLFNDDGALQKILVSRTPAEAKKLGRTVQGYEETIWCEHRNDIVVRGNYAKFSQNNTLKKFLLNTHNRILVEASPRDRIWGIGMGASNPDAENPAKWRGLNLLGFALMQAREQLS